MTFVTTYKQADLTLTGTMRKAQLAATATKTSRKANAPNADSPTPTIPDPRRRASSISTFSHILPSSEEKVKECRECRVKFSPKWWPQNSEAGEEVLFCHKCHWRLTYSGNDVNSNGKENEASGKAIPDGLVVQETRI